MGKEYELVINGRLPNLNDYINKMNRSRWEGAKLKKDSEATCMWQIRRQLKGVKISRPVRIHYFWYEQNQKRDLDNVAGFGHKVIQDALVQCGTLTNDGWKNIIGYTDTFAVDRQHPRIVVLIEEVNE